MPVVLGLLLVLTLLGGSAAAETAHGAGLRVNELQVVGTHNSYHREISEREQAAYDAAIRPPATTTRSSPTATPRCHGSSRDRPQGGRP